jgi:hypothetical protein
MTSLDRLAEGSGPLSPDELRPYIDSTLCAPIILSQKPRHPTKAPDGPKGCTFNVLTLQKEGA